MFSDCPCAGTLVRVRVLKFLYTISYKPLGEFQQIYNFCVFRNTDKLITL